MHKVRNHATQIGFLICVHINVHLAVQRNCPQRPSRRDRRDERSVKHVTSAVACTLTVKGKVEGLDTHMLVDTGSSVTLLHEKLWKQATNGRMRLSPVTSSVMAVNGESLVVSGQADVSLQIGDHGGMHCVLVIRDMTQECLLVTDFLQRYHCVIDLAQRTLTIGAGDVIPVPLYSGECAYTCHVLVKETTVIPAYHQVQLPVNLAQGEDFPAQAGLFEPKPEFDEDHGSLLVTHSVSPVKNGQTTIRLLNPTSVSATVYSQEKIGKLSLLQEAEFVHRVEPALDKVPAARSKAAIGKAIDAMLLKVQGLTVKECVRLEKLLYEVEDVISMGDGDLVRTSLLRHTMNTGNAPPIHQQARRLPFHQRDVVQKMIHGMLEQGIIEPTDGSWSSPIVLVKKQDGSFRFCVDYRRVNDITKKDVHPIPRIDDTIDTLAGARWFSTIDLASGYWQVEMDEADKEKTTFVTPFGLHQFRVMPFGLTNAPSTFQRLMGLVLAGLCWQTCLVYLDDIIIFSRTVDEHFQRLTDILRRLKEAGLKIKPNKCQLMHRSVQYLGYVVSENGMEVDPAKTSCVNNWPVPTDQERLRQFLGFASYYRKFIKNFAQIAGPLHVLTEKTKTWQWSTQCEAAFNPSPALINIHLRHVMRKDFHLKFVISSV